MNTLQLISLALLSCCFCGLLSAQDKYSVEVAGGPQLTLTHAGNIQGDYPSIYYRDEERDGWSATLYLRRNFGKMFLRSGIAVDKSSFLYWLQGMRIGTDMDNGATSRIGTITDITSVGVPLEFGYSHVNGGDRLSLDVGGGVLLFHWAEYRSVELIEHQGETLVLDPYRPDRAAVQISYSLFTGLAYRVGKRTSVSLEPRFEYAPRQFPESPYLHEDHRSVAAVRAMLRVGLRFAL